MCLRSSGSLKIVGALVMSFSAFAANVAENGFTPAQRNLWSLQKVVRPPVPVVKQKSWVKNPVDAFILAKLETKGVHPSQEADRVTLLRRASFDLIGLPPTPEEVQAFVSDQSPNAWEKVVDRLLASPHYGERWGRHWLDVARFAESQGFKADETRANAWRFRDYVVASFNSDKPFDRFIREQIAGDEIWPDNVEARIATSFNRHYPDEYNARNLMQRRQEILNEVTNVVGSAFLGLTVECAQCHNHKFDPISHKDYYSLQAFFANSAPDDRIVVLSPQELQEYQRKLAVWEGKTREIREQMSAILAPARKTIWDDYFDKYPPEVQEAITKPADERTPYEAQLYHQAKLYIEPTQDAVVKSLKGVNKQRYAVLAKKMEEFDSLHPGELPVGSGMRDLGGQAPPTNVLAGGTYLGRQEAVEPAFLSVLSTKAPEIVPSANASTTRRRTALANWLASPENPLTGRVMANRVWYYHFGSGLAPAPSDFGSMGGRPSHPELLDWLTREFVDGGWSIKKLNKLIVMSNTYQQASVHREDAAKVDERNRLLWRFPRTRLEGEVIRDSALFVAGALNEKVGGPSVFPVLPENMPAPRGGWSNNPGDDQNYRRSVYIFVRRNTPYPLLKALDFPDTTMSCGRRDQTITAPQALSLLNDRAAIDWAQKFAGRVISKAGLDARAQVDTAYQLAYSRKPDGWETDTVLTFLEKQSGRIRSRIEKGEPIALPAVTNMPAGAEPARLAALVDFCNTIFNSNEFVYQD
ncbi:MAG TPA: DUF1549 and DUF1553 domain-containing protein [Bryobacteraceae bacterium]|nr:DUF1549 and DUF1553 domain-containing protein [Bryobacteraceae bacterium]